MNYFRKARNTFGGRVPFVMPLRDVPLPDARGGRDTLANIRAPLET
jgi:hypothetical protein